MDHYTLIEILLSIFFAVISGLSQVIFDKIFNIYKPEIKKFIIVLKTFFVISIRYFIPIAYIIYLLIIPNEITKYFVFSMAILCSVLVLNVVIDLNKRQIKRHIYTLKTQKRTLEQIESIVNLNGEHFNNISSLAGVVKQLSQNIQSLKDIVEQIVFDQINRNK